MSLLKNTTSITSMDGVLLAAALPAHYGRDMCFAAKTVTEDADRAIMLTPGYLTVNIGNSGFKLTEQSSLNLADTDSWDSTTTDYTVAANRAGLDFFIYACNNDGKLTLLLSRNSTFPEGYDADSSRKIGGFHCLCSSVGAISDHALNGYLTGDILPASVWDLLHRPACNPAGMVYVEGIRKWVDIYLASASCGELVSEFGGTIATGTTSPAFHQYKFSQWFGLIGKRLLTQHEFVIASLGSNQGTNINGSANPVTTGGNTDTSGRRMISDYGGEDFCGVMYTAGSEPSGGESTASWTNAYDANDSDVAGQHYMPANPIYMGGHWASGVYCGSRCASGGTGPLAAESYFAARGMANNRGD